MLNSYSSWFISLKTSIRHLEKQFLNQLRTRNLSRKLNRARSAREVVVRIQSLNPEWDYKKLGFFKFASLIDSKGSFETLLEFGTSGHGALSTFIFNSVSHLDSILGRKSVVSVDLDYKVQKQCKFLRSTQFFTQDAVNFAKSWENPVDVVYLDSLNLDLAQPQYSINHHLDVFQGILSTLKKGTLVFIDDSPNCLEYYSNSEVDLARHFFQANNFWPGKGAKIIQFLPQNSIHVLFQERALIFRLEEDGASIMDRTKRNF